MNIKKPLHLLIPTFTNNILLVQLNTQQGLIEIILK